MHVAAQIRTIDRQKDAARWPQETSPLCLTWPTRDAAADTSSIAPDKVVAKMFLIRLKIKTAAMEQLLRLHYFQDVDASLQVGQRGVPVQIHGVADFKSELEIGMSKLVGLENRALHYQDIPIILSSNVVMARRTGPSIAYRTRQQVYSKAWSKLEDTKIWLFYSTKAPV
jgi:hypothetical protein